LTTNGRSKEATVRLTSICGQIDGRYMTSMNSMTLLQVIFRFYGAPHRLRFFGRTPERHSCGSFLSIEVESCLLFALDPFRCRGNHES
jgi:hypothetical protein